MGLRIDSSSSPGKTPCRCLPACVNHGETFTGLISAACHVMSFSPADFWTLLISFPGDAAGGGGMCVCVFVCTCVCVCVFSLLVVSTDYWIYKNFFKIRFGKKLPRFLQTCVLSSPRGVRYSRVTVTGRRATHPTSHCLFTLFGLRFAPNRFQVHWHFFRGV